MAQPQQRRAVIAASVVLACAAATLVQGYGTCGTNSCNSYVTSRICDESTVGEDAYAPTETFYRLGVIRDLEQDNGGDFGVMCAWQQAIVEEGLLSDVTDLDLIYMDAGTDIAGGIRAGLCMRESGINLAVGPTYSTVTQGVAMIGSIYEENNIATTATSPTLSDTDTYGFLSRVIASDDFQGAMLARYAVQTNDWLKLATISIPSNTYFQGITKVFEETATGFGAEVTSYTVSEDFTEAEISEVLRKIRESGVRVIMAAMVPMRRTLLVANETGMLGEGWAWLTSESTISVLFSNMWNLPASDLEDMDTLLDGVIGLVPKMDSEGEAYQQWIQCIDDHYDDTTGMFADMGADATARAGSYAAGKTTVKTIWNGYYYDATQVALRSLASLPAADRSNATLVRAAIRDTPYNGTSGLIQMDSTGDRVQMVYEILNIFNRTYNVIGTIDSAEDAVELTQVAHFPGDTLVIPVDYVMECNLQDDYDQTVSTCHGSSRTVSYTQNSNESRRYCDDVVPFEVDCDHALYTDASMPLTCVGLGVVLIATGFLLARWGHKVIRLSQREFLLIMMIGAFVSLAGPLISVGPLDDLRCAALPCFTAIGYVLLFGPLFVKTWRVNKLVHNTKLRIMKISNYMLYRRLAVLILLTTVLLVAMFLVDPPHPEMSTQPVTDSFGQTHLVPFETCAVESETMGILVIVLLGLMTIYGCFVSYQIRNVSSELSEARWIFVSVYNGALLSTVTLAVVLGLDLTYAQLHLFATLGIVLTCIVTVSLIMAPKLVNIYKDVTIFGSSSEERNNYKVSKGASYLNTEGPGSYLAGTEGSGGLRGSSFDRSQLPTLSQSSV